MHCASCVARVERALAAVPGVLGAGVNLATGRATVTLSRPLAVGPLLEAVRRAGFRRGRRGAARRRGRRARP